jgi:hypothetical protein
VNEIVCDLCGNPTDGYVCRRCADKTAVFLVYVVDLAGEVETNVARLARYATRNGRRAAQLEEVQAPGEVNRRQPVLAFGFQASRERPLRNALRAEPLPVDLNTAARAAVAFNHVATWRRLVEEERGLPLERMAGPVCNPAVCCEHDSCCAIREETRAYRDEAGRHPAAAAAAFLLEQLGWIRHQRFADEAFDQLRAAGAVVKRIVDRPPDEDLVGMCDCGLYLYAYRGRAEVQCRCGLRWWVQSSRETLMEALRDRLVTVSEAATLAVMAFPDLQREKVRKLVQSWVRTDRPNHLVGQVTVDGPVYPFGEILDRLSRCVVRVQERDRVTVTA